MDEKLIRLFSVVFQGFKLFLFSTAEQVAVSKELEERRFCRIRQERINFGGLDENCYL